VNLLEKHVRENDWSREQLIDVIGKVNRSTERISNIVRGLRNFSRLDKDASAPFNLVECCLEATSLLAGIYNKEGIQLTFNAGGEKEIWVEGNSGKLQQVLINLISNAKDATEGQESRTIEVSLTCDVGGSAVIRVEDNGPGVPVELREKIFEPFFTTKEVNKGTGIGLSLVHTIVQEHQGHILLEEKSEGASFRVELPVLPKAA
jgi:signal transduction histidine kinase